MLVIQVKNTSIELQAENKKWGFEMNVLLIKLIENDNNLALLFKILFPPRSVILCSF